MDFANAMKYWEQIISSWDNWIWIVCFKISLLWREYLSSGVNVLASDLKILDTTKTDIFKLEFSQSDVNIR